MTTARVHCVWALKKPGYEAVIVNNNPETVSTDFDTGDRLYFDPLTPEDVRHIMDTEKPYGVVVQFGGQTAIKLTKHLDELGVHILGTPADSIDAAEDRERFDELLEQLRHSAARRATPCSPPRRPWRPPTSWATRCCCAPPTCWAGRT